MPPKGSKAVLKATKTPAGKSVGKKKSELDELDTPTTSPKASTTAKRAGRVAGDKSLADAIYEGLLSVGSAVVGGFANELVKQYTDDDAAAVATLVCVVCRAAGVPDIDLPAAVITDESGIVGHLDDALARIPASMPTYLLVAKDQKKFRKAFVAFFDRVVEVTAAGGILLDGFFMKHFWPWLSAMVDSKARNFRHTATAAVFAMVGAISDLIGRADRAVESAKGKEKTEATKRRTDLTTMHHLLFNTTLHSRGKDVSPDIRLLTFQTLRHLIANNPTLHLTNAYLKYVTIALHDKKVDIRLEGLDTIVHVLGELPEEAHRMREFLQHYAARLVEMAADVDTRVADLALKVAALMVKLDKDSGTAPEDALLGDDMIDRVLMAIADDRRVVRTTAGTLLRMFIRCRVDSSSPRARHETLCNFSATLRTDFHEANAERYIVDAMWADAPPLILSEYQSFVQIARDGDSPTATVATALGFLAAIAQRCVAPIDFGPVPKDDQKIPAMPQGEKAKADPVTLRAKLTKDLVALVADVLESHGSDAAVQRAAGYAVAALDMSQLGAARLSAQFTELLNGLRRVSLLATDESAISTLLAAWRHVVQTDSPARTEAESQLQQLLRAALKQVKDADTKGTGRGRRATQSQEEAVTSPETVAAWRRVAALSSLVGLTDQWGLFTTTLTRYVVRAGEGGLAADMAACACVVAIVDTLHRTALWHVAAMQEGGASLDDVTNAVADVAPKLIALAALDSEDHASALHLRATAAAAAADLLALPYTTLSTTQQEEVLAATVDCVQNLADATRAAADKLRDAVNATLKAKKGDMSIDKDDVDLAQSTARITAARRRLTLWEAALTRIVVGVSRLFTFDRLDRKDFLPTWLLMWTRVGAVKPAADVFKTLFHVARDDEASQADASALERAMLIDATKQCVAAGSNPTALDQLHQVGLKLASMHFLPTDKYYPAAKAVVRAAMEYAEATDDTILHAASAYCARLRVPDALAIATSLTSHAHFRPTADATQTPFVRAFVSAVRRAAKLEAAPAAATTPGGETPGAHGGLDGIASAVAARTGRTAARKRATRGIDAAIDDDDITVNIVREAAREKLSQKSRPQPPAESPGGWRGRGAPAAQPSQSPRRGRTPQASQQPPLTLSSMLGDDEVFIRTQEWA
jgi:cohesin complex subunit SA-1/2